MSTFWHGSSLRKACGIGFALLMLPLLGRASVTSTLGSVQDSGSSTVNGVILALNGPVNVPVISSINPPSTTQPPPVVPEANTGIALIPFVGAILLFASRRFLRSKAAHFSDDAAPV